MLGDNQYLMGDEPCGADATAFAFIAGSLCPLFDSPVHDKARTHAESRRLPRPDDGRVLPGFRKGGRPHFLAKGVRHQ